GQLMECRCGLFRLLLDPAEAAAQVELGRTKSGNQYTLLNLGRRLGGLKQDPWKDMGRLKQRLPDLRTLRRRWGELTVVAPGLRHVHAGHMTQKLYLRLR